METVGEGHWVPPLDLRSSSTRREKNGSSQLTDLISKKDVLEVPYRPHQVYKGKFEVRFLKHI